MSARPLILLRSLLLLASVVLVGLPQFEQDPAPPQPLKDAVAASAEQIPVQLPPAIASKPGRPALLAPLYASYVGLQALDIHSTRQGLSSGDAREANPLMKGAAQSSAGLIAIKAASTVGVIYGSEKLWKKNRLAAVLVMVGVNSATAWVVAHNYSVAK